MILKWLQSVFARQGSATHLQGPPPSPTETPFTLSKLYDVAHEVLAKDALEKKLALQDLEKHGTPFMKRQRLQQKVKIKVKKFLSIPLSTNEEEEVVEEVTERITDAASADSHLSRLFDESEKN